MFEPQHIINHRYKRKINSNRFSDRLLGQREKVCRMVDKYSKGSVCIYTLNSSESIDSKEIA